VTSSDIFYAWHKTHQRDIDNRWDLCSDVTASSPTKFQSYRRDTLFWKGDDFLRTGLGSRIWDAVNPSSEPKLTCFDDRDQHEHQQHYLLIEEDHRRARNIPWIIDRADYQLPWNNQSKSSGLGIWPLTSYGIGNHADDDETWTTKQDIEDWKNNAQTPVLVPHGPHPYGEDHCWTPINTTRNRDWTWTILSDKAASILEQNKFPSTSWMSDKSRLRTSPEVV
jgi:hypothetical protein